MASKTPTSNKPVKPNDLLSRFETDLPVVVDDIETLVACESPSNDLDAVANSAATVGAIGCARLGVEPEAIVVDRCTHLRWRFGPAPAHVLLLCHHDTVWPIGTAERLGAGAQGDIIRGPGCLDMKAGIAMAFHALSALPEPNGVTLLITGDEEVGSPTSRDLIEQEARHCSAVFVLEPSASGALKTARKGRAQYRLEIAGRAAHAGVEPSAGLNSIVELARHVLAIDALNNGASGTTVTPTIVGGGTTINTVPAHAELQIDVRAASLAELNRIDRAVTGLRGAHGYGLTVDGGIDRPPLEPSASEALFRVARGLAPSVGLDDLQGVATGGGSDGNLTASLGVPTLDGLGAVGEGLHADHEHVLIPELPRRTALVSLLIDAVARDGVPREAGAACV